MLPALTGLPHWRLVVVLLHHPPLSFVLFRLFLR